MTARIKLMFQYSIYPVYMLSAWFLILWGIQSGLNQYLATIPVIIVYGIIILLLEKVLPFDKEWLNGSDWNLDLTYYIINYSIKTIAQIGFMWLAAYLHFFNWFPTNIPFGLQVILALIIIDFFLFFVHWQSHKYEWLWKLHAIHHSSERLYFLNGEKRHAIHQILEGLPGILICMIIGASQEVVVSALALLAINMMMQHTNLDYKSGILKKFFCVAELHRWHHRADFKDAQVNFGAWLTIWDKIFKTNYDTSKITSRNDIGEIGIKEEPNFPKTYLKQALYPFNKRIQNIARGIGMMCLFIFFSIHSFAQNSSDDIVGKWKNTKTKMTVEVYKTNNKYSAKIISAPDKSQIGKVIIWDLVFDKDEFEWNSGKVQLPNMAHSASCFVKLKDLNTVNITGYHGLRLFGSTETYYREK